MGKTHIAVGVSVVLTCALLGLGCSSAEPILRLTCFARGVNSTIVFRKPLLQWKKHIAEVSATALEGKRWDTANQWRSVSVAI